MSSKKLFSFCTISIISLFLLNCSLQVGESPRGLTKVSNKDMVCVRDLGKGVEKYLNASLTQDEIHEWATCVNDAIYNFDKYTRGENPDHYTVDEVAKTVNEVVFPDRKITYNLVAAAMTVKKFVVGGESDIVTRVELERLQDVVWTLEDSAVLLNPYIPILNLKVSERPQPDKVERAGQRLFDAIAHVLARTENYRYDVDFISVNEFIVELQKFNESDPQAARAYTELARNFYNVITGQAHDNKLIQDKYSVLFFKELSYWYRLRLLYIYHLRDKNLLEGEGLPELKLFVDHIFSGVKSVIERYEKQAYIDYDQMEALIDGFYNSKLLPEPFKGESVKSALRPFFDKIFGDLSVEFADRKSFGVSQKVVAEIEAEFYKWYEIQNYLQQNYGTITALTQKNQFVEPHLWPDFLAKVPQNASHFIEIKSLWMHSPLRYQWSNPILVFGNPEVVTHLKADINFYQMSLLNILSAAVRLVARGYPVDMLRSQKALGLTEQELDQFVNDFELIWQDLTIMPPDAINVGKKMFIESNLFTPSGNGFQEENPQDPTAHLLTFAEGVELISMLYSGYSINKEVFKAYEQTCHKAPPDVFGYPTFVSTCFWNNFKNFYASQLETMPGMKNFLNQLEPHSINEEKVKEWETFVTSMSKLVRTDGEPADFLGSIHMGKATMILHYIESMIYKFDLNGDGLINHEEGLKAYPHFRGILNHMAKDRCRFFNEEQLFKVFQFILKFAKVPGGSWEYIWEEVWAPKAQKVDHLQIIKIFRQILAANSNEVEDNGASTCFKTKSQYDEFNEVLDKAEDL